MGTLQFPLWWGIFDTSVDRKLPGQMPGIKHRHLLPVSHIAKNYCSCPGLERSKDKSG
jgi:hypothetical protein